MHKEATTLTLSTPTAIWGRRLSTSKLFGWLGRPGVPADLPWSIHSTLKRLERACNAALHTSLKTPIRIHGSECDACNTDVTHWPVVCILRSSATKWPLRLVIFECATNVPAHLQIRLRILSLHLGSMSLLKPWSKLSLRLAKLNPILRHVGVSQYRFKVDA